MVWALRKGCSRMHRVPRGIIRRLCTALCGGFILTAMVAASNVSCYGPGRVSFVTWRSPDPEADRSYEVGWLMRESGDIERFRFEFMQNDWTLRPEVKEANKTGRPNQRAAYTHVLRGEPWACLELFHNMDGRFGIHHHMAENDLEQYPTYVFHRVRWNGLVLDVFVWGAVVLLLLCSFDMIRVVRSWRWRRSGRCGRCGYSLRGLVESRCPECGSEPTDVSAEKSGQELPETAGESLDRTNQGQETTGK
jgi:hypothetical protein